RLAWLADEDVGLRRLLVLEWCLSEGGDLGETGLGQESGDVGGFVAEDVEVQVVAVGVVEVVAAGADLEGMHEVPAGPEHAVELGEDRREILAWSVHE